VRNRFNICPSGKLEDLKTQMINKREKGSFTETTEGSVVLKDNGKKRGSSIFRLEEGVSRLFVPKEGLGEVLVVFRCPVESLSIFTLSILCVSALWCVMDGTVSVAVVLV